MPGPPLAEFPEQVYQTRCVRFAEQRDQLAGQSAIIANVRLLAFAAAVGSAVWGLSQGIPPLTFLAALLLLVFAALVRRHTELERRRERAEVLRSLNDHALHRLARAWGTLPRRHTLDAAPDHPYARDLDLFGKGSLFHLLETVSTRMGERTLAAWLLAPASPAVVRQRQGVVAELAPLLEWRQELAARGILVDAGGADPEPFLTWAEDRPRLRTRPLLLWAARVSPPLLWASLAGQVLGLITFPLWLAFLGINLVLDNRLGGAAHQALTHIASAQAAFGAYASQLHLLVTLAPEAPLLRTLRAALVEQGIPAHLHVRRLQRLAGFVVPKSSLAHSVVQALTLWDLHVLAALERWQAAVGGRARAWLGVLGEVEALAALAGLQHDHPDWTLPELDPRATTLDARGLGHPLLRDDARVANDVTIGPPGTFLLVTGSNMSGKSTLLRAVGVNVVLAQAGGPVCAASLRLPPVDLWTSMRVQDALVEGVSHFMAELRRIKQIVDAADAVASTERGDRRLLYLLDEIFHGTNSAERQIAARRIVRHLLRQGAIGAVSTHDLELASGDHLSGAVRAVHFSESFTDGPEGARMAFDYTLRPGVATSRNALRLMELVGLRV